MTVLIAIFQFHRVTFMGQYLLDTVQCKPTRPLQFARELSNWWWVNPVYTIQPVG